MLEKIKYTEIINYCRSSNHEVGGYIDQFGQFRPLTNTADDPSKRFRFDVPDDAIALIHSHPDGPFAPSVMDQRQQLATDIPWLIVAFAGDRCEHFWFGDNAPMEPLVGRGFRHYVTDCYAACRDLYRTHCEVTLPHFPREWKWWQTDADMLNRGYVSAGFHPIDVNQLMPGDALLMRIGRAGGANHSAVWLGESLIYHHVSATSESDPSRLATVESVGRWTPHITAVLRHEDSRIARAAWPLIRQKLQV